MDNTKPGGSEQNSENVDYPDFSCAKMLSKLPFAGAMQYERIKFTDSNLSIFKSSVYYLWSKFMAIQHFSWETMMHGVTFKGILIFGQLNCLLGQQSQVAKSINRSIL